MTRVLIVSDASMFSQGLAELLREYQEIGLEYQEIDLLDRRTDIEALPACLEQCRPDVLFFGCSDSAHCPASIFMRCLRQGTVQRIICVDLTDNAAYVFHGERHAVAQVEDLVEAIVCRTPGAASSPAGCEQRAANERKEATARTIPSTISQLIQDNGILG